MSALSDGYIFDLICSRKLKISPLMVDHIQPAGIDLPLGPTMQILAWDSSAGPVDAAG